MLVPCALALSIARVAVAQGAPGQAQFARGQTYESALEMDEALRSYRASIAAAPSGPFAGRARARAEQLALHEADRFAGLRALARFRERMHSASSQEALALARDAAQWARTPARDRARSSAAEVLVARGSRREAMDVYRAIAADPSSGADERALALHELSALGERGITERELRSLGADRATLADARRLARREHLRRAAWSALGLQWALGLWALWQARRARTMGAVVRAWKRPLPIVHLAVLCVGGALPTRTYDGHDASHVWAFAAAMLTVYLSASAASAVAFARDRAPTLAWRAARAMIAVCAALAASFLSMRRFDPGMLDGISL